MRPSATPSAASDKGGEAPLVGVIMGSTSDWETMGHAVEVLERFDVPHEKRVVSAHRTPEEIARYAAEVEGRGLAGNCAVA